MWNHCVSTFSQRFYGMPMSLIGIVVLVLLVLFLFKLFTKETTVNNYLQRPVNSDAEDSLHILQVRLAKGVIGVEEFERLKSYL